jgi:hypothetical protein
LWHDVGLSKGHAKSDEGGNFLEMQDFICEERMGAHYACDKKIGGIVYLFGAKK